MVGKDDELGDIDDESLARVKQISNKKRQVEETADQVCQNIKECFDRLAEVLKGREKQLLRQVEAIHRQQLSLVQSNSELLPEISNLDVDLNTEQELVSQLLNFGKINLSNSIAVNNSEPYKVEEYQEATEDYVSFDKSLKSENEELDVSSVLRRKRDNNGNVNKIVSINFSCMSCDKKNSEVLTPTSGTYKGNDDPTTSETNSPEKSLIDEKKDNNITFDILSSSDEKSLERENVYFEDKCINVVNCFIADNDQTDREIASKATDDSSSIKGQDKLKDNTVEHPVQIQQWLQQILAETETEPIIHEIGQFSKVPNTRMYREFAVET